MTNIAIHSSCAVFRQANFQTKQNSPLQEILSSPSSSPFKLNTTLHVNTLVYSILVTHFSQNEDNHISWKPVKEGSK